MKELIKLLKSAGVKYYRTSHGGSWSRPATVQLSFLDGEKLIGVTQYLSSGSYEFEMGDESHQSDSINPILSYVELMTEALK